MSGKGSKRRPQYISDAENALRWQLFAANPSDKPAILEKLEQIKSSMPIPDKESKL